MRILLALCGLLLLAGCSAPTAPPETAAARMPGPAQVEIPAIGVNTPLTALGTDESGKPAVPPVDQPEVAAWSTWTPKPGSPGAATLIGHVSGIDGPGGPRVDGVFHDIPTLTPGDPITVTDTDGARHEFVVTKVEQYPKTLLPVEAIWGDVPGPELRLITCGGIYDPDNRRFLGQDVVYAVAR